jgi:hypothetical protein
VSHWDERDIVVGIVGQCSNLSEAQWQQITESLPEPRCDAQTISKLAEIPGVVIKELHDAIEADRAQPTRSEMANELVTVRASRQVDQNNPNMLAVFGANFSDCESRTPEQVRKRADEAVRDLRKQGKGNKRYYPQSEGIDPATKCALIVSVKLDWPAVTNRQAQAACEALWAVAGGDTKRRWRGTPTPPNPKLMGFGAIIFARRRSGAIHYIAASSNAP